VLRVSEPGVMEDIGDGNAMQLRRSRILVRRLAAELEKDLRGEIVVADVLEHEARFFDSAFCQCRLSRLVLPALRAGRQRQLGKDDGPDPLLHLPRRRSYLLSLKH
jgi:hypothetical protein